MPTGDGKCDLPTPQHSDVRDLAPSSVHLASGEHHSLGPPAAPWEDHFGSSSSSEDSASISQRAGVAVEKLPSDSTDNGCNSSDSSQFDAVCTNESLGEEDEDAEEFHHRSHRPRIWWKGQESIVVSGASCRLPESDNMDEFKENLMNQVDMITEDNRRWDPGFNDLPRRHGKLKDLRKFDAVAFGVHPKQAQNMDPQIRILLEVAYEAIIDSGQNPQDLRGSRTGVFVGCSGSETGVSLTQDMDSIVGYSLTGCVRSMFANRLSYSFDFRGPSVAVDTACSSSLQAFQLAMDALRDGQCDAALVAGAHLTLTPNTALQFLRLGMLASYGSCKSFDSEGEGYVRSEGIVAVFLQRISTAYRVYAEVLHAKTSTDGFKSEGITFPSGDRQAELLRRVYQELDIPPASLTYLETHGTGTKVGDPQEANAIDSVFCGNERMSPLLIGSVKSNMGHCEPASGLAAVAKVIIAMESGVIPGNLHYKSPNTYIPGLTEGRLKVVSENTSWDGGLVGINSFGFGGSNVHIVLRSYNLENQSLVITPPPTIALEEASERIGANDTNIDPKLSTKLVCLAGRTEASVQQMAEFFKANNDNDHVYSMLLRQSSMPSNLMPYRGYAITQSRTSEIQMDLDVKKINTATEVPRVWFVYSGMGSQWTSMGRDLLLIPSFKASIRLCATVMAPLGVNLIELLTSDDVDVTTNTLHSFVCIAAIQIALTDCLKLIGLLPTGGMVGHSVGELVCGYCDGCLTLQETMLSAYWRGKCVIDGELPVGAMAAVGLTWEEAIRRCPEGVVPACHNAEDSVTISGPAEKVTSFVDTLVAEGTFAKMVRTSGIAFHSYFMQQIAPALREKLNTVILERRLRSENWISSSIPEHKWCEEYARFSSPDYYVRNLTSPVLFNEALQKIPGNSVVVEIAPHCLLQSILKRTVPSSCSVVGLMKAKHENNLAFFYQNLGKLYQTGCQFQLEKLTITRPVSWPAPRGTPMLSSQVCWDHSVNWPVITPDEAMKRNQFEQGSGAVFVQDPFNPEKNDKYLLDHIIDGRVLFPFTGYLVLAWRALCKLKGLDHLKTPVVMEDIRVYRATIMNKQAKFIVTVSTGTGAFEVQEGDVLAAAGQIHLIDAEEDGNPHTKPFYSDAASTEPCPQSNCERVELSAGDVYKELLLRGYEYGPQFRGILNACNSGERSSVAWNNNFITFIDALLQCALLRERAADTLKLPTRLLYIRIDPQKHVQSAYEYDSTSRQMAIDCRTFPATDGCVGGGIEIRSLVAQTVPRRNGTHSSSMIVEKVLAFPYKEDDVLRWASDEARLAMTQYAHACNTLAETYLASLFTRCSKGLDAANKHGGNCHNGPTFGNKPATNGNNHDWLDGLISDQIAHQVKDVASRKPTSKTDVHRLHSDIESLQIQDKSLAKTLGALIQDPETESKIIPQLSTFLSNDELLNAWRQPISLKTLLDLCLENTHGHHPVCGLVDSPQLEFATTCKAFMESQPLIETDWNIVVLGNPLTEGRKQDLLASAATSNLIDNEPASHFKDVTNTLDSNSNNCGTLSRSNSTTTTSVTEEFNLMVVPHVLRYLRPEHSPNYLSTLFAMTKESGFVLVSEETNEGSLGVHILLDILSSSQNQGFTNDNTDSPHQNSNDHSNCDCNNDVNSDINENKINQQSQTPSTTSPIGYYKTHQAWLDLFSDAGFRTVAWTRASSSSGLGFTNYLLRKPILSAEPNVPRTVIPVDDVTEFSWVETAQGAIESKLTAPPDDRIYLTSLNGPYNGVTGLGLCLKEEETKCHRIRCVTDVSVSDSYPSIVFDMTTPCPELKERLDDDLTFSTYRDGQWIGFRHIPVPENEMYVRQPTSHAFVNTLVRGDLSSLCWLESRTKFYRDEMSNGVRQLCAVYFASLNFRDIMLATGRLSADDIPGDFSGMDCLLGMEFSGRLQSSGNRVMGLLPAQALCTYAVCDQRYTWPVPDSWTLEDAATVPVVYSTAYYALVVRARLRRGESVLIHAGSGGVGLAAIAVATAIGCKVYTTISSQTKRQFLIDRFGPGVFAPDGHQFADSRSLLFEQHLLNATNGRGVDVVLNSLAGDKLQASVRCLARHGRFLEIGKVDLAANTALGMAVFAKNIAFHGILLDALFDISDAPGSQQQMNPDWAHVHELVAEGLASGVVRPLPTTVFDSQNEEAAPLESAFRFMAQGKHIGKVLIQIRQEEFAEADSGLASSSSSTDNSPRDTPVSVLPSDFLYQKPDDAARSIVVKPSEKTVTAISRTLCDPESVYLITGGLGGFGLELAQLLINRGARKLVLTSRSGVKTGYQARLLYVWKRSNVMVQVSTLNVASEEETRRLFDFCAEFGPLGGVFHLAMVLRDTLFENQTADNFKQSAASKYWATRHLDAACRTYADTTGVKSTLKWFVVFSSIASGRGHNGQTNYGWANSCMERIVEKRRHDGHPGIAIQWGAIGDVGVILESMGDNSTVVGGTLPQRMPSCLATLDLFLTWNHPIVSSYVRADTSRKSKGTSGSSKNAVDAIANILGVADVSTLDPNQPLGDLGLDSLMGVEIRQTLERDFDIVLSMKDIRSLTINKIQALISGDSAALQTLSNAADASHDLGASETKNPLEFFGLRILPDELYPSDQIVPLNNQCHLLDSNNNQTKISNDNYQKIDSNHGENVFFVHSIEGVGVPLRALANQLKHRPVWCLQWTEVQNQSLSIEDVASTYIKAIKTIQSNPPYTIIGYSYGASVACEIALQLQAKTKSLTDKNQLSDTKIHTSTNPDGSHQK